MIVKMLLQALIGMFDTLWIVELPDFPEIITTGLNAASGYLVAGANMLAGFLGASNCTIFWIGLELVVALNVIYAGYSLVMWVLKKIPMLGIQE
ncbi:MAG: hypothetical protein MR648_09705 [Clostridiales bacterium]|nr:hypothetical protein [Clostridiales bacterium]MDY4181966.1 hypothetical protein [Pseudoflavonifractor sp.]